MHSSYNLYPAAALAIALLAMPAAAKAQRLDAAQCRSMAVAHNARVRNAQNAVSAADETRREAFTKYFPSVSATAMGFNADKGTVGMSLAPQMRLSMAKGGIVSGVSAVQPVFAGGQIVNGNRLARVGADVSRLQLRQAENAVALAAEQYFWQIIALQEKRKTVAAVDSMLSRLVADVEVAVRAGLVTRNDLLQVNLRRNETEMTALQLDDGISLCRQLLAQHIGLATPDSLRLDAAVPTADSLPAPTDIYAAPDEALALTSERALLEKNVEANRLRHRLSVGQNLPTVAVGAGYVYHDVLDQRRSFGTVFATVSIPISDWWGGTHAARRQKLQLAIAENELADKSELLKINMQKSWNDLTEAYRQVAISRSSIAQSAENLRLNEDHYKAGTAKMADLLEAQSLYQQSRDQYVDAYAAYQVKRLEYMQATGR